MTASTRKGFVHAALWLILSCSTMAQDPQTDRAPFAIEFPELNSGLLRNPKESIARADVSLVKFWILNPVAQSLEWAKIRTRVNNQPANKVCSQSPVTDGKVMRCDLNRVPDIRLGPKENFLEIEATTPDGRRYYASFRLATESPRGVAGDSTKPSAGLTASGRKFAVVMGVSKYIYNDAGLGNLEYADDDAEALRNWLLTKGGFTPDNVLFLTNEQATLNTVRDSLRRFLTKAGPTNLVLFFFAGHGTPDPYDTSQLYYLVADSKVTDLKRSGLPMVELKQILDRELRSQRVIFLLDTCHSAGLNGKSVVGFKPSGSNERGVAGEAFIERQLQQAVVKNDVSQAAGRMFGAPGRMVITSSGAGEASRESASWGGGHGVFTWAVLEGLKGKADANSNGVITADELYSFVRDMVRTETKNRQTPQLFSTVTSALELAVTGKR